MSIRTRSFWTIVSFVCSGAVLLAQSTIENWPAPASWSPSARVVPKGEVSPSAVDAVETVPTPPLHFVGLNPCRLVDTRGNGFTGPYGPPALTQGVPRNFVLTGQCGISATAQAVSLNVTVTNTQGPGFILIYPQGAVQPTVSTLNYVAGQTIANAAVVPLGTGGGITVIAGVSGTDLILDTNGDYPAGVVTSLSGLSGDVTLAPGSNVTITPTGQTLTVAATGGPGGVLPTGSTGQTLRNDGSQWVANSALTSNGTDVGMTGTLNFSSQVRVGAAGTLFLHNLGGANNTYVGLHAGATPSAGDANTGVGFNALLHTTSGGNFNVAMGQGALDTNTTGSGNIGIGNVALENITTGSGNIGIGNDAGMNVSSGSNNIYIGNAGFANESGQIRIGTVANITSGTVIVGISGFTSVGGAPVLVNGGGRLGTTTSSRRFKDDIRDIAAQSDGLMKLRPVAFRYKPEIDPTGFKEYGLVAEEVAQVYPEMVINDDQGRPETIRYQLLDPLLLNELQKQHRNIEAQQTEIDRLKAELAKLQARIETNSRP